LCFATPFKYQRQVPRDQALLAAQCWNAHPAERPSFKEILKRLQVIEGQTPSAHVANFSLDTSFNLSFNSYVFEKGDIVRILATHPYAALGFEVGKVPNFAGYTDDGSPFKVRVTVEREGEASNTIEFKDQRSLVDTVGQIVGIFHSAEMPLTIKITETGQEIELPYNYVNFVRKPTADEELAPDPPLQQVDVSDSGAKGGRGGSGGSGDGPQSRQPSGASSDEWDDDEEDD
jgi:hypothetical protein